MKKLRFKQFLRERNQFSKTGEETLLSVSEYYGVKPRAEAFESEEYETRAATLEGYRIVKTDDLVMNYMLAWKGAYGVSNHDGIVSPAYSVFKVEQRIVDVRYLHHLVRSDEMKAYFRSRSKGIIESRLRLYPDNLLASYVEIPDLPTQRAIADFLDRETARIDLLIEKKQRLAALLGERSTNQLELLLFENGFELRKLRREAHLISKGTTPSTIGAEMVSEGVRFLKAENVTWQGVSANPENYISEETHKVLRRSALEAGDVLVVIAGATTGKTTVMPMKFAPANTNQAVSFVRLIDAKYAAIVCAAIATPRVQHEILLTSVQSAQPNLSMEDLGNLMLPFPDESALTSVLGDIDEINAKSHSLSTTTNASIDRLKEYRAALITAAVTGQIDVTTYARTGQTDRRLDAIQEEMEG